jgi:hypothetical protein
MYPAAAPRARTRCTGGSPGVLERLRSAPHSAAHADRVRTPHLLTQYGQLDLVMCCTVRGVCTFSLMREARSMKGIRVGIFLLTNVDNAR